MEINDSSVRDFVDQVGMLRAIAQSFSAPTLALALESYVQLIRQLLGVERVSIFLLDNPYETKLHLRAATGLPEGLNVTVRVGDGIVGGAALQREPALRTPEQPNSDRYRTAHFIVAPLIAGDRVAGVLCATERSDDAGPLGTEDLDAVAAVTAVLGSLVNQRWQESRLRDAGDRFSRLLQSLPIGFLMLDAEGRIGAFNDRLLDLLGIEAEAPVEIDQLLDEENSGHVNELRGLIAEGHRHISDSWPVYVNDCKIDLLVSAYPASDKGGCLMFFEDCSLERTVDELRRLDELKQDFVAMVSHELRTPLTSVKGAASLLRTFQNQDLSDNQLNMLGIIENNIDRLSRTINKILDVSLIESRGMQLIIAPGDLIEVLEKLIEMRKPEVDRSHLQVVRKYEENARYFSFDAERLFQAIDAVFHNAIKFSRDGGSITVELYRNGNEIHLSICDEGQGIPQEYRHLVFQKFFQIEEALTRRKDGAGLGLYFARSIAELHGGDLNIRDSQKGAALEFTFKGAV